MIGFRVHFIRTYLDGNLAGIPIKDSIRFPSLASANRWCERVEGEKKAHKAFGSATRMKTEVLEIEKLAA